MEYYFLTPDEFRARIAAGDFLEYEEVYTDKYYGTLKSEVERRLMSGDNVIFDVDVVGVATSRSFMATVLFRSLSSPLRSKICGVVWKDAVRMLRK